MNARTVAVEIDEGVLYGEDRCPICAASHRTDAPVGSERILVAEDDPSVATLIAYNLEQDGYRVTVASDGDEAVRALVSSPPELLVLDLLLPLRSGWQVLREMRARLGGADLPVLVVSALACDRLARQLAALGAQAVIGKPFSVQELRETVRRLVARRLGRRMRGGSLHETVTSRPSKSSPKTLYLPPTETRLGHRRKLDNDVAAGSDGILYMPSS
jgi:two-component system phosphate regulon response regulator PhoB